ncbi:Anaerobic sulfatase-maturating enzyme [compost metagenome]
MHKGNVVDSNKFLALGEELGIHVNFSLFTPSGKGNANNAALELSQEDLVYLGMLLAKNPGKASIAETPCAEGLTVKDRCGIGTHLVSVNADGTVYPCHITMLPNLAMGNLLQQDLKEIMYTSAIAAECREMTVETVGQCKSCDYKIFCGGGCRANALYALDDIMGHDPHCSLNKAFLKEAVETTFGPEPTPAS